MLLKFPISCHLNSVILLSQLWIRVFQGSEACLSSAVLALWDSETCEMLVLPHPHLVTVNAWSNNFTLSPHLRREGSVERSIPVHVSPSSASLLDASGIVS